MHKICIREFLDNNKKFVKLFVVVFYAVGIAGMAWQVSYPFFVRLIPFALIMSLMLLACYQEKYTLKNSISFLFVFLAGFLVEVWGVNTGVVFGEYSYASGLGPKLLGTPLIIGVNWLLLVYTTASILEKTGFRSTYKIFIGALLMLVYDFFMEQIAPDMDMWHWQGNKVPMHNYLAWFLIALLFHSIFKVLRIKTVNPVSAIIFICQFLFFVFLSIILK